MAAKKSAKRVDTVKELLSAQKSFDDSKKVLDENQAYLENKFGLSGGTERLPDGTMVLTPRVENGRLATRWAEAWADLKQILREGKIHQMSKDEALKKMTEIEDSKTNPQLCSHKVVGKLDS